MSDLQSETVAGGAPENFSLATSRGTVVQPDKVACERNDAPTPRIIDLKPNDLQRFASSGSIELPPRHQIPPNEYVLLKA
ncbi:MAG: hypothetical protein L7V87_13675, partial [Verrucomicrobiales bacterium]|nr:hypothetical protein [Verrucomicrobiales bacterium]